MAIASTPRKNAASGLFQAEGLPTDSRDGATRGRAALLILLVEDDANDERIIRNYLRRSKFFDCTIEAAADIATARQLAAAQEFDVMILDFWVKAEDSLSMLAGSESRLLNTPAVVVSSLDMTDVQSQSLTAGAMAYLHKNDLSASALDATLRTLLYSRAKEDKLRRTLASQQSEQQAMRDNTAELAHEIMNTLNAVHGFAEIMTSELPGPAAGARSQAYPALIHQGSGRLISILQRYLAQIGTQNIRAELTYGEYCLIDVTEQAVTAMAKRCSAKSQDIDVVAMTDRLAAQFDQTAIYQLMVNLISNAHKYSPAGAPIRITLDDNGDHVRLSVIDQGVGMSKAELSQALRRYARVVAPAELAANGHGLGFAVITSIVDMHGGTLEIDSEKDWGTTIVVRLPKKRPALN